MDCIKYKNLIVSIGNKDGFQCSKNVRYKLHNIINVSCTSRLVPGITNYCLRKEVSSARSLVRDSKPDVHWPYIYFLFSLPYWVEH